MTTLKRPHSDFRLELISPIDVRAVGLDQLLTQLWLKLLLENRPAARRTRDFATIAELAQEIERPHNEHFRGFENAPHATEAWLRADLIRPLKKNPHRFTVARPLHANALRLRSSTKQADDSNASLAVYSWLWHVDKGLLKELRRLVASDVDLESADLVTSALVHLGDEQAPDRAARPDVEAPAPPVPISVEHARIYADDVRRLLAYQGAMPRPALIAHLQRLTGFHLGIYLLKTFEIVVGLEDGGAASVESRMELVVDFGDDARTQTAKLAEDSWQRREQSLQQYVRAHLALKKLHQYAERAETLRREPMPATLAELAALELSAPSERFDAYFDGQLQLLLQDNETDKESHAALLQQVVEYQNMGMTPFRVYLSIIVNLKALGWVAYHRQLLDSLLSKNTSDGLLRQPLGGRSRRRASMGASLLETLTLIALVSGKPGALVTQPLRVDELIARLETRYGLRIASPPRDLEDDFETARVLAENVGRFKATLRETGLFRDLSDAFVAQLVRPRFTVS